MRLKVKNTRTGKIMELMPVAEHNAKIDATLEKMRTEFSEYKANKNKEKDELITANRTFRGKNARLIGKAYELKRELRQREQDDASAPWYDELKKERNNLQAQVYNLDAENRRTCTFAANRAAIADQQYATVVGERAELQAKLSEKIHLYVHAKKVIAAFEREITKTDKNFWQVIIANPELPELKEYIEVKESYDAERKRKLKESYQPEHQNRTSSRSTTATGNRDSIFAGGQVQTGQAQAVSVRSNNTSPVFAQAYGRGNRRGCDAVEASRKSFAGILSGPEAVKAFQPGIDKLKAHAAAPTPYLRMAKIRSGEARVMNVPTNADYITKADLLIAIRGNAVHVVKNRFGTSW